MIVKGAIIDNDLKILGDGIVWQDLSRKIAEALWNTPVEHGFKLYRVRRYDGFKVAIEKFEDIEQAFRDGYYVCIEVGRLSYNTAFGYVRNLQEILSQAESRLTDTKDYSREEVFDITHKWAKEFTEKYENCVFEPNDYYDLIDTFIYEKLSD